MTTIHKENAREMKCNHYNVAALLQLNPSEEDIIIERN